MQKITKWLLSIVLALFIAVIVIIGIAYFSSSSSPRKFTLKDSPENEIGKAPVIHPPKIVVHTLERRAINITLDPVAWQKIEFGYLAIKYSWEIDFLFPKKDDWIEIRIEDSDKAFYGVANVRDHKDFRKAAYVYVRGKGILYCRTFAPFSTN